MKNIYLYAPDGLKTLEFKFSKPEVEYNPDLGWGVIRAAGRTITISGTPFIVFDEDISSSLALLDFSNLWKEEMNEAYKDGNKVLSVFLQNGIPILTFYGKKISLKQKTDDYCQFEIDDKVVILYKMNFLILSKDK